MGKRVDWDARRASIEAGRRSRERMDRRGPSERQPPPVHIYWEGTTTDRVHRWSVLATLPQLRKMHDHLGKLIKEVEEL